MKQKIFQFAVLYHERTNKDSAANIAEYKTKVIIEPKTILAQDDKTATLKIARELPEEYTDKLQDIEILLRPF